MLEFFDRFTQRCARSEEQFIAVVEVCGFNDELIRMLRDYPCHKVVLIQPEERKRYKTDRCDASALSEEPEEVINLSVDEVTVKSFVGGLIKGFERIAA